MKKIGNSKSRAFKRVIIICNLLQKRLKGAQGTAIKALEKSSQFLIGSLRALRELSASYQQDSARFYMIL